jgi:lipid-binding SYLF domain-containing protein
LEEIVNATLSQNFVRWSAVGVAVAVLAACASTRSADDVDAEVKKAEATLTSFKNDQSMTWLRDNLKNARAVMVSPNVLQAGFIVGGAGGRAMIVSRGDKAQWNGPAFYTLATGSLGLQAGAQSSEMVALLMSEKAVNSMLSSSFKFGADLSASAGPVGAGAAAPVNSDIVVFTRSKGLYGGANMDGSVISVDEKSNAAYYKKPASPVDILVRRNVSNPASQPLLKAAAQ